MHVPMAQQTAQMTSIADEVLKTGADECNCVSLRRASRRVTLFYDARLALAGIRATQYSMLALIEQKGELRVNELAEELDLERSAAGQNLKVLERHGLVMLRPSDVDRRAKAIRLTELGQRKVKEARVLWRAAQAEFERLNGTDEASQLRARLARLSLPDS